MLKELLPLKIIFDLNTKLFINSFEEIDEEAANERFDLKTNSMIFIACHLLDARYHFASLLKIETSFEFKDLFDSASNIDDMEDYPTVSGIKNAWTKISQEIMQKLHEIQEDELIRFIDTKLPINEKNLLGEISFLIQHESYHIGQLGFLRKSFGYPSLSYH